MSEPTPLPPPGYPGPEPDPEQKAEADAMREYLQSINESAPVVAKEEA